MNYIGIDLGTTNSAIAVFDGEETKVYKSKGQSDVTPSNIYIDKNGKRFYGRKAYEALKKDGDRVASKFKRFMGTGTDIKFAGISMSPIECSAEILRELMRCLPEEIANSDEKATVITVPAAFDQRQNAATEEAAKLANIGKVALMPEPVAAIMSVTKNHNQNGSFLIFDMGGGTLDIAIATCFNGKVDLVGHGGVSMCGGADIDTRIVDNIVIPWIMDNYDIPDAIRGIAKYEKGLRIAKYYVEDAKIELSSSDTANIYGSLNIEDESGDEIELDIEIERDEVNSLIEDIVKEAVDAAKDTIEKTGIAITDFNRIVFIGGPTNYKPLRDKVSFELGIKSEGLEVNPMTAVAEGAAIFAETIDWSTQEHNRKGSRAESKTSEELGLSFKFESRTTEPQAKVGVKIKSPVSGYSFQICSVDSGWDSGLMPLENGKIIKVPLSKRGVNKFDVVVYDNGNRKIALTDSRIEITQVSSSVGAILASHSLGIEVSDNAFSDATSLDYLIKEGEKLPVKGNRKYKSTETIKAGSSQALTIKVWEGDIKDNIQDNRYVGCMKVEGTDLEYGTIKAGEEIILEYSINEAMALHVTVNLPRLEVSFSSSDHNFYDYKNDQVDMSDADTIDTIASDGDSILQKVNDYEDSVADDRLGEVRELAQGAKDLKDSPVVDPEIVKKHHDNVLKAKKLLDKIRKDNLSTMRRRELEETKERNEEVFEFASDAEKQEIQSMYTQAEKVIEREDKTFENIIRSLNGKMTSILFKKSDSFVVGFFQYFRSRMYMFSDKEKVRGLITNGITAIQNEEFDKLRSIVVQLFRFVRSDASSEGISDIANIMRG